jgi:hypothetical protein
MVQQHPDKATVFQSVEERVTGGMGGGRSRPGRRVSARTEGGTCANLAATVARGTILGDTLACGKRRARDYAEEEKEKSAHHRISRHLGVTLRPGVPGRLGTRESWDLLGVWVTSDGTILAIQFGMTGCWDLLLETGSKRYLHHGSLLPRLCSER